MAKSAYLTALYVALFSFAVEVASSDTVASAQEYPGCFMVSQVGNLVELNALCATTMRVPQPKLVFTDIESQLILEGTMAQVRGTVTNLSSQVVSISRIYFQLVADTKVLASSTVLVATGNGLNPGESLSFDKVLSKSDLRNIAPDKIKVQIIKYE